MCRAPALAAVALVVALLCTGTGALVWPGRRSHAKYIGPAKHSYCKQLRSGAVQLTPEGPVFKPDTTGGWGHMVLQVACLIMLTCADECISSCKYRSKLIKHPHGVPWQMAWPGGATSPAGTRHPTLANSRSTRLARTRTSSRCLPVRSWRMRSVEANDWCCMAGNWGERLYIVSMAWGLYGALLRACAAYPLLAR